MPRDAAAYLDLAALIDDARVTAIPIGTLDEPFIDVALLADLGVDTSREKVQKLSDNPFQLRSGVAERLVSAQAHLPPGYTFQLKEGWRPIWVQRRLWESSLRELRERSPAADEDKLRLENARFVAPPDAAPPHSTGGAFDVALLHHGQPVDMGWGFNEPGAGSLTAAPVGPGAREVRNILAEALNTAGFVNYPQEWWHWSYGDRYWAFQTSHPQALYPPR